MEAHLRTAVTDHFPANDWKQLDAAEMIDEPDLDQFVFIRCLEDIPIIGDPVVHKSGSNLIVRYARVRKLLLERKVELL
jgi:DNA replication complex GINS protein SLD5 C-terminus